MHAIVEVADNMDRSTGHTDFSNNGDVVGRAVGCI